MIQHHRAHVCASLVQNATAVATEADEKAEHGDDEDEDEVENIALGGDFSSHVIAALRDFLAFLLSISAAPEQIQTWRQAFLSVIRRLQSLPLRILATDMVLKSMRVIMGVNQG